jgi:hypothetical protein
MELVCPSTDEWIEKMWYIHNGIPFSNKKNEVLSFMTIWMSLKDIMSSEISKAPKDKQHMISLIFRA